MTTKAVAMVMMIPMGVTNKFSFGACTYFVTPIKYIGSYLMRWICRAIFASMLLQKLREHIYYKNVIE